MGDKRRLDLLLVTRGLAPTRSRASDLIKRGAVTINGAIAAKPGQLYAQDVALAIAEDAGRYVSRGAFKLIAALDAFGFDGEGRNALDVGASTGGFTQVLLERGASHVTAVDVGQGQMADELRYHARVTVLENMDARDLTFDVIGEPVTAITADVSFISLTKALPAALNVAMSGCWLVALIKPQFEAGREAVGKGGIVRGAADRERAVDSVRDWLEAQSGWRVTGVIESPITGGDGNREYLFGAEFRV